MNIVSLDIGGTAIKSALVSSDNTLIDFREQPSNAHLGKAILLENILSIIDSYSGFDAVGISFAGQVNTTCGYIIDATGSFPDMPETPLASIIEERFKVPVTVDNDVNCAALAEGILGSAKNYTDFLCLAYGTGVGGAIVLNKNIYYGANFSAGEFGHMLLHGGGTPCPCGMQGCYEAYASATALVRAVSAALGKTLNGREICKLAETDAQTKALLDAWINEVVYGIASLCHIFNPPCVVLGGGIMADRYIISEIQYRIPKHLLKNFKNVEVLPATLGNKAGILGASLQARAILIGGKA